MKLSEYVDFDATGLASLVNSGEVKAIELAQLAREAHDEVNPKINAVIEFYDDAETVAANGRSGGLFNGVPFLRKDFGFAEAGRLEEKGSRLFKGNRWETDSYYIRRARAEGLRVLGRTTTPELGISGMSKSILTGVTGNPWDPKRTAGGSSAGAAAAVATGIAPIASASDGGGSTRTPAAWCGLVGLNPSRGRISGGPNNQDSGFGFSRQFVVCKTVRDMAAALDVFSGPYPGDPFVIVQPDRPYVKELTQATGRLRVGVARTKWGAVELEPEVTKAIDATAAVLSQMGHLLEDIHPPHTSADYSSILLGMADFRTSWLQNAARLMGREINAETLEPVNLKLHEHGRNLPLSHASEVHETVRKMRLQVGEAIRDFDILLTPTMPSRAIPHGGIYCATHPTISAEEYMNADAALYQYVGLFNVTGQPAVSLPLAQSDDGLPIGIQIVARFGDESTLVRVARDLEDALPWRHRKPGIRAGVV
ncbi:amidase [Sinorhizobium medicae]|nr:amidase [Sinorhizobium medicae]